MELSTPTYLIELELQQNVLLFLKFTQFSEALCTSQSRGGVPILHSPRSRFRIIHPATFDCADFQAFFLSLPLTTPYHSSINWKALDTWLIDLFFTEYPTFIMKTDRKHINNSSENQRGFHHFLNLSNSSSMNFRLPTHSYNIYLFHHQTKQNHFLHPKQLTSNVNPSSFPYSCCAYFWNSKNPNTFLSFIIFHFSESHAPVFNSIPFETRQSVFFFYLNHLMPKPLAP